MLPRKNRLSQKSEFDLVKKEGKFVDKGVFSLGILKRDGLETRVGIITSKTFSKKAVERNRAKRIISIVFTDIIGKAKIGSLILVIAKKGLLDKNRNDIGREIKSELSKKGIL